jgi:hypothetical protein
MTMLAEIADKMPTVAGMWITFITIAVVMAGLAMWHRWAKIAMVVLAAAIAVAMSLMTYSQVELEGTFSEAIRDELSRWWIVSAYVTGCVPLIAVLLVGCNPFRAKALRLSQA